MAGASEIQIFKAKPIKTGFEGCSARSKSSGFDPEAASAMLDGPSDSTGQRCSRLKLYSQIVFVISCDEKKRKAVALQEVCLERIRSLFESRNKQKEAFTKFKDLGLTVWKVSRYQFPAKEETSGRISSSQVCTAHTSLFG